MSKVCFRCKIEKPFTEFRRREQSLDKHSTNCKSCYAEEYAINKLKGKIKPKERRTLSQMKIDEYLKDRGHTIPLKAFYKK